MTPSMAWRGNSQFVSNCGRGWQEARGTTRQELPKNLLHSAAGFLFWLKIVAAKNWLGFYLAAIRGALVRVGLGLRGSQ